MLMTSEAYRDSLRAMSPRVFINGDRIDSVADEPLLAPGVNAIGLTYDFALETPYQPLMVATEESTGREVNRFNHINRSTRDLLNKLEAVRFGLSIYRLRPALPDPRCAQCHVPGHPSPGCG